MDVNKLIIDLLVVLIQSPYTFVKAMGFRLAAMKREITETRTKTMAVDGVTLFINPHWTSAQSKVKLLFVLLHEACHVWMLHPKRLRDIYPSQRDIVHQAADYVVNLTLEQARCPYPMPDDALINRDYVDANWKCLNVERVVQLLLQQPPEQPEQPEQPQPPEGADTDPGDSGQGGQPDDETDSETETGKDTGDGDESGDESGDGDGDEQGTSQTNGGNGSTPESCGELLPAPDDLDEQEHVKRNEQALQLASSGAGSMPANMLEELHHQAQGSATDWLTAFKDRFATAVDASDWSEERFNQQYAAIGMIEPTLYTESVGTIAIVVDESSSMDNDQLNRATEQVAAIVSEWTPQRVLIIRHTAIIEDIQELFYGQQPEPREKRAHGGTYFRPVIEKLEDEIIDVACWVTDCMPMDSVPDASFPIIWLGTGYGAERCYNTYNLQGDFVSIDE